MMVVMQLFTNNPESERNDVAAVIFRVEVAIANRVTDAVDDVTKDGNPHRHRTEHNNAPRQTEEHQIDARHDQQAQCALARVNFAFHPIGRATAAILGQHLVILGSLAVKKDTAENNREQTFFDRRMWIAFTIGECMMLAMASDPLERNNSCGKPKPRAHELFDNRMKLYTFMRCGAVQVQRHTQIRDVTN